MREEGNSRPSEVRRQAHHLPKSRQRLFCHPQEPGERVLHRGDAGHDDPLCDAAAQSHLHRHHPGKERPRPRRDKKGHRPRGAHRHGHKAKHKTERAPAEGMREKDGKRVRRAPLDALLQLKSK